MIEEIKKQFTAYWHYIPLATACKNNIFDLIANGKNTPQKLAQDLAAEISVLKALLKVLENDGFLLQKENKYFLTEKGKILTEKHPQSLKYACILWSEEHLNAWQNLDYTLKTGKTAFEKLYGTAFFDFLDKHPEKLRIYHRAIYEYARDDYKNICQVIDFEPYSTIADIGGGLGAILGIIRKNFPQKKLILFERPQVIAMLQNPPFETISGDFFAEIPVRADLYILSRVLHDWNDAQATQILKNLHSAMSCTAHLLVIENFADYIPDSAAGLYLNMRLITGGKERTKKEYFSLLRKNGFHILETKQLNDLQWIIKTKKHC